VFVIYDLTPLEGCAQAILVDDYFSNFGNIVISTSILFEEIRSSVESIWPILCSLEKKGYHAWLAHGPNDLYTLKTK
jgi:hypothetical protein